MKKNTLITISILLVIIIISSLLFLLKNDTSSKNEVDNDKTKINNVDNKEPFSEDKGDVNLNIKIIVDNKTFTATLEDNETSKKFVSILPLEINMSELHGNEKYYYLDKELPTNSYNPKKINNGDIMLFGSDCLVLFYKTFNTSYSYTKLGSIDNPDELDNTLGNSNVTIRFESRELR
jgi:hypothetical protein